MVAVWTKGPKEVTTKVRLYTAGEGCYNFVAEKTAAQALLYRWLNERLLFCYLGADVLVHKSTHEDAKRQHAALQCFMQVVLA